MLCKSDKPSIIIIYYYKTWTWSGGRLHRIYYYCVVYYCIVCGLLVVF